MISCMVVRVWGGQRLAGGILGKILWPILFRLAFFVLGVHGRIT